MILLRCVEVFVWMWLLSGRFHPRRHLLLHRKSEGLAKLLQGTECALVRYLLNIHLTMRDKLEKRYNLTFKMLVKKLKYINVFFALGTFHHNSKRRGGRRERGRKEGGLWPVPRIKLNKFHVRAA